MSVKSVKSACSVSFECTLNFMDSLQFPENCDWKHSHTVCFDTIL